MAVLNGTMRRPARALAPSSGIYLAVTAWSAGESGRQTIRPPGEGGLLAQSWPDLNAL